MRARDLLGPWGEAAAAAYLRKKGFRIEAMNYRTRLGEIDIIAADRRYLIFCEVKLRKSADFAAARELGLRAEHALSLPARCAPETAGALVAHTVEVILQERAATARSERGVS
jgi:Holliday junction resolvase-like predicted endonuclease